MDGTIGGYGAKNKLILQKKQGLRYLK